ncbi:MAG: hypothetical protein KBF74_11255 [Ferruginibacter sp.]|nr:hypothetical protein [Ferruginibacter sp.]
MDLNKTVTNYPDDIIIHVKLKIALLWVSVTLCYLYGDYFELYIPQKAAGLISGQNLLDSPLKLFAASVLLAIPAVMVFLSVVLKARLNRWLNLILGIFFTLIMLLIAINSFTAWRAFYVFLALVESTLTALITWYAFTWSAKK